MAILKSRKMNLLLFIQDPSECSRYITGLQILSGREYKFVDEFHLLVADVGLSAKYFVQKIKK